MGKDENNDDDWTNEDGDDDDVDEDDVDDDDVDESFPLLATSPQRAPGAPLDCTRKTLLQFTIL